MRQAFRIRVPASTSNLGAGFDTLGLALQLYLEATVQMDSTSGLQVELRGEGAGTLPQGPDNPVVVWAREIAGDCVETLSLEVRNNIPVAGGLGSSAAACVAGVAIGYLLRDGVLPAKQVLFDEVSRREGHPDNAAPAIWGGLRVSRKQANGAPHSWPAQLADNARQLLLVVPRVALPTQQSRAALPKTVSLTDITANLQNLAVLLTGLAAADWPAIRAGCMDHLHEPYRLDLVPGLRQALQALRSHDDCAGAFLSGAGPTLAAFIPPGADSVSAADNCIEILQQHNISASARVALVAAEGLQVTAME